ncbi:cathepsin B-like [Macrobrachium rosenbergii]|uniref:cathepsin B-like n=1 Tax=Macrobrachium rosenbergii TaxID=79674 RepID=UPI0034D5D260
MKGFLFLALVAAVSAKLHYLSDEYIQEINGKQSSWKAGRNFAEDTPLEFIKGLLGVIEGDDKIELPTRVGIVPEGFEIPESFDSREAWPHCPTISEIRDQGSCGSCWAVGAVSVMSDRECIHNNDTDFRYSDEDLVSCCWTCGMGCNGGWLKPSFNYWINQGIVSGGRFNSSQGCKPYSFYECEHHSEGERPPCEDILPTPDCTAECIPEYGLGYEEDKRFGSYVYTFDRQEQDMQYDIMTNGPVEASFNVYNDFLSYKSGVYKHTSGILPLGGHAIRIIGWGVEGDEPYWLVANSWNYDWGDNGLFKILRGTNECGIEGNIVTGIPKVL